MSPNEKYVLDTLAASVCGAVTGGEDPPDGYIIIGQKRIAVEVTRLMERVSSETGDSISRLSIDAPAEKIAVDIESDIADRIPATTHVFLIISSPVNDVRKTKSKLQQVIVEMIESDEVAGDIEIFNNKISINIYRDGSTQETKISSAIACRHSSSNITENVGAILTERITTKNLRRNSQSKPDEYWLALYNDYWVADIASYRFAYRKLQIPHEFDQIYIVDGYRRASPLW